ncbi:hypothetical protein C8Q77DRAFT_1092566 [Trametes polyzona]|nr:hypothetical protein C8Q77DRAFT_1092566 [Trametes polyzona]
MTPFFFHSTVTPVTSDRTPLGDLPPRSPPNAAVSALNCHVCPSSPPKSQYVTHAEYLSGIGSPDLVDSRVPAPGVCRGALTAQSAQRPPCTFYSSLVLSPPAVESPLRSPSVPPQTCIPRPLGPLLSGLHNINVLPPPASPLLSS